MKREIIVTGAAGHLGGTIIRELMAQGVTVRGLVLPGEFAEPFDTVRYYEGDVRDRESMRPLFDCPTDTMFSVIHTAGLIDISEHVSPRLYSVNVEGTKNIIALCEAYKVDRLLYVSSVHAIPVINTYCVMNETDFFSPDLVIGGYAKTKAEATQAVLDAGRRGLDVVVVHPSGILGPYNNGNNHMVQLVNDYCNGSLPAGVQGGYDFVDVRDVAHGCCLVLECGREGECYILSNRHYGVKELLTMLRQITDGRWLPVLPMWMAKAFLPLIQLWSKVRGRRPLYTKYALLTLCSNDKFSHDKATAELNYRPRDLYTTLNDTVEWIRAHEI